MVKIICQLNKIFEQLFYIEQVLVAAMVGSHDQLNTTWHILFKILGSERFFLKKCILFQQGCIKLIKSDSKDIYSIMLQKMKKILKKKFSTKIYRLE